MAVTDSERVSYYSEASHLDIIRTNGRLSDSCVHKLADDYSSVEIQSVKALLSMF